MKEFNFTTPQVICELQRKSQTAIRPRNSALFAGAAALICEYRDRLTIAERERKEMVAFLKEECGCACCSHVRDVYTNPIHDPCAKCDASVGKPNWKWKGGEKL